MIELLAVVAIIALFTSGAVALVTTVRSKTRDVKRVNSINSVEKVMGMVNSESGTYDLSCNSTEYCFGEGGSPPCFVLEDLALLNCDISKYINKQSLADPAITDEVCDGNDNGPCNFGLFKIPDNARRYAIYYHLEGIGGIGSENCVLTDRGTVCGDNVSWFYCTSINLSNPNDPEKERICPIYDSDGNGQVQNSDKNDYF